LNRPRKIEPPPTAKPAEARGLPARPSRRIVVRPEEVFPQEPSRIPRRSFEGAVARYVLVSAAIVIGVSVFAMVAMAVIAR
jgi:hypothetical protein